MDIVELTKTELWGHCPGTENPADIGSRGCFTSEIVNKLLWWDGPSRLRGPQQWYLRAKNISKKKRRLKNARRKLDYSQRKSHYC